MTEKKGGGIVTQTEAQKRAKNKWKSANMKRIPLDVRTEEYEALRAFCEQNGEPVNGFIRQLIRDAIGYQSDNSLE